MGPSSPGAQPSQQRAAAGLVGREAEIAVVERLLATPDEAGSLVLEGPAGVGKTSLWEHATAAARAQGFRVLVARASLTESGLPYAAVIDLLDGVGSEELAAVPGPQLRALEVALYRADPSDRPPEPQVVSLALLSALRALAAGERVVVAVDDVQWLDHASQEALAYAARRLSVEPVTFLLARRPGRRSALEQALPEGRALRVDVAPTTIGGTRQILAARLGLRLPHHLLRQVFETTLGNPLFVIEMGRMLSGRDLDTLGEDLPLPDDVEDLLGLRVADLEDPVRGVLLALALEADLRAAQVRDLAGEDALVGAVEAGVVIGDGERVRAAHPLFAAAAKRGAREEDRLGLHRRLAEVVPDEPRRALHLALSTQHPDDGLATRAGAAAELAAARGAAPLAVALSTHALRLTPPGRPDVDRVLALGHHLRHAGEKQQLTDLLCNRVTTFPPGADRVEAYLLLADAEVQSNRDILDALEQALIEAGDDLALRARVLAHLAENEAVVEVRDVGRADARAVEAVASAKDASPEDRRLALSALTWTRALRALPVDAVVEEHEKLVVQDGYLNRSPHRVAGQRLVWRGELADARRVIEDYRARAEERAEPTPAALARLHHCELELRAGRWDDAQRLLDEWAEASETHVLFWPMYERCRALLAAGRGEVRAAREWGSRAVELAETSGVRWDWLEASRALGLAALLAKEPETAAGHLSAVWDHTQREGVLELGAFPAGPDLVEALTETGGLSAARDVVEALAALAERQDHPWARLAAERGRHLLALHADYAETAAAGLESAASAYADGGLDFDAARTLLALGRAQRRARKWGAAREVLERALSAFEAMGSPGWAQDARAELERVGARRPATEGGLTPTERRVADLAVQGLANKEIARSLVVTVNTVEFHLRNAYAKLGIRSRVQLAAALQEHAGPPD